MNRRTARILREVAVKIDERRATGYGVPMSPAASRDYFGVASAAQDAVTIALHAYSHALACGKKR